MRYDHNDTELAAAFAAVRQYDPGTYARMEAAGDWHVSTDPFSGLFTFDFTTALMQMGQTALESNGITLPRNAGEYAGNQAAMTWVNQVMIGLEAEVEHISAVLAMADTLVHEFAHIYAQGHNEPEAFRASSAFGSLLPAPDGPVIKRDNDETLAEILVHPEHYPTTVSD